MKFLNNRKPDKGWRYRVMKTIVAINHYLTGKITRRHNEELWVYMSKNPEMFEELVVRKKMEQALRSGNLSEIIENWDKMASIMNLEADHLKRDEKIDDVHLGTAQVMKDISNKLREYQYLTQREHLPWAGYMDDSPDTGNASSPEVKMPEQPSRVKKVVSFYKKYAAVAAVLLVVSMGISAIFFFPGPSNDQLFEQYYQPYSFKAKNSASFHDFQKRYVSGDFQLAKEMLHTYEAQNHYERQLKYFYTGLAEMETGNVRAAADYFDLVQSTQPDTYIKDEALWYQGLAYLKLNKESQAYSCFKSIKNKDIRNRNKARKIIWKMR